jgi:hypothetical protein
VDFLTLPKHCTWPFTLSTSKRASGPASLPTEKAQRSFYEFFRPLDREGGLSIVLARALLKGYKKKSNDG